MNVPKKEVESFCDLVWQFYKNHGRSFAWRNTDVSPYQIVVSEVMLQQTQTYRVEQKYAAFLACFPSIHHLAQAALEDVLSVWQGLGYNRRAKMLHEAARIVVEKHAGSVPADLEKLDALPGIGKATAASICAFAFNMPTVFVETNIRAVFIHHFFKNQSSIDDKDILPLVALTLDHSNPREWYYALMDYGVLLKKQACNPARKSAHYVRQSRFEGSDRQVRGALIRFLLQKKRATLAECEHALSFEPLRIFYVANQLIKEGFLALSDDCLCFVSEK